MSKKGKHKTVLIDGIRYYADKPDICRKCFFWKNRKVGCILGRQNCYYLAEAAMTVQEKKCEGCCYAKGRPCVSAACYKELDAWLRAARAKRARKEGTADAAPQQDLGNRPGGRCDVETTDKEKAEMEQLFPSEAFGILWKNGLNRSTEAA